jgi:hypothetical protein
MGMMFPLGLSTWRRHSELLPFFWSANGITSMFASVLGMALSIEFGIAHTYALGVGFYAVCGVMVAIGRRGARVDISSGSQPHDGITAVARAPSIQPAQMEMFVPALRVNEEIE